MRLQSLERFPAVLPDTTRSSKARLQAVSIRPEVPPSGSAKADDGAAVHHYAAKPPSTREPQNHPRCTGISGIFSSHR
ncbi:hypothetical protein NDU88_012217 [Pleurodeles waltl]|uniref:Uncharacterized protein n=1 Tax=Pleurodeles waltl TaxID=8319 RepID=A0AAV7QZI4_PLEWA|nr:hypothetical protein NDU88_012217 [Pleurodeles waltl]